ncbi:hypothetical protein IAT38_004655 [Cryptococcus sp. DSM 104549]
MPRHTHPVSPIPPKQHIAKYTPQSPHPASPPQTPSPADPAKPAVPSPLPLPNFSNPSHYPSQPHDMVAQPNGSSSGAPATTPDAYTYSPASPSSPHHPPPRSSSSSSLSGMGINFQASNPLPIELHSPVLDQSPDATGASSQGLPALAPGLAKSRSDDAPSLAQGATIGLGVPPSAGMAYSLSAGSGSGSTSGLAPSSSYAATNGGSSGVNPNPASYALGIQSALDFTPPRPRTVSPRPPSSSQINSGSSGVSANNTLSPSSLGVGVGGHGGFTSSSAIGLQMNEPRGRVISPHKADTGGTSPPDYVGASGLSSGLGASGLGGGTSAGDNPYDPPHLRGGFGYNSHHAGNNGGFPLTGKESHLGHHHNSPTVHPAHVPFTDSVGYWLGMYFFFNLGLTLFNKFVLVGFPFPYTLTGLHALSGCVGCYVALERGAFTPARLTQKENLILAAFSVLYTINIAVSNISLQLVSIPFHQVVRASTPLFTIVISTIFLRTSFSFMKLVSLLPVVAGVGFATYGDYSFTAWGMILTLLGTFFAALKTVVTNLIQTGAGGRLKLHPLDLLMRMSPLAFIQCVVYGWYTGELERVRRYGATQMTRPKAIALLVNGVIACGLNIVSFTANKKAGALTMTVSANCKQVLTIALAVILFDLHISPTNGIGILLTLIGGGWYGYVEYQEKKKKTKVLERN